MVVTPDILRGILDTFGRVQGGCRGAVGLEGEVVANQSAQPAVRTDRRRPLIPPTSCNRSVTTSF